MRIATIGLSVTLLASVAAHAQTQLPPEEFGLTAFVLTLRIPTSVSNPDGTPMRTGPQLWAAIKNTTSIPYSLCTSAKGVGTSSPEGATGGLSGDSRCNPYWVLLPGETRTESLPGSFPKEPDTGFDSDHHPGREARWIDGRGDQMDSQMERYGWRGRSSRATDECEPTLNESTTPPQTVRNRSSPQDLRSNLCESRVSPCRESRWGHEHAEVEAENGRRGRSSAWT
jgi:hypothetical protein